MPSPLIRQMRLSQMLRELRETAGMTNDQAAKQSGLGKAVVSRLENSQRMPDVQLVMKLLDAYAVGEDDPRYRLAIRLARDANERGWWDRAEYREMDGRAKVYADIESGATAISAYQMGQVPGFLQTAGFIAARGSRAAAEGLPVDITATSAGRLRRQAELLRPGGPKIEVVVEEVVIRRMVTPPHIMAEQMSFFVDVMARLPQVTIQVLPVVCDLTDVLIPGAPFDLYAFEDLDDGRALLINTVSRDILLCGHEEVGPYASLFDRLRDVAFPAKESAALIKDQAASFAAQ